jgi:hypothetical protein
MADWRLKVSSAFLPPRQPLFPFHQVSFVQNLHTDFIYTIKRKKHDACLTGKIGSSRRNTHCCFFYFYFVSACFLQTQTPEYR